MSERTDTALSPPFKDSDAIEVVIKRLELVADSMRRHKYDEVLEQMAEVGEWLGWLAQQISKRTDGVS